MNKELILKVAKLAENPDLRVAYAKNSADACFIETQEQEVAVCSLEYPEEDANFIFKDNFLYVTAVAYTRQNHGNREMCKYPSAYGTPIELVDSLVHIYGMRIREAAIVGILMCDNCKHDVLREDNKETPPFKEGLACLFCKKV